MKPALTQQPAQYVDAAPDIRRTRYDPHRVDSLRGQTFHVGLPVRVTAGGIVGQEMRGNAAVAVFPLPDFSGVVLQRELVGGVVVQPIDLTAQLCTSQMAVWSLRPRSQEV